MEPRKITITRKTQLLIDSDSQETHKSTWENLNKWRYICFKAANLIITHHFIQSQVKELIYFTEEVKVKLNNIKVDENGILMTSRANTSYQILSKNFKSEIPTAILSSLNQSTTSFFNSNSSKYFSGELSLPNYRRNIPIPIQARDIKNIQYDSNIKNYRFSILNMPFRTYFGKGYDDKRGLWERAQSGEIKLCTSSIMMQKKKIFLLTVFQFEKSPELLNPGIVAEASLSIEIPIIVKIGKERIEIGNKEEFMHRRISIQRARHRFQKSMSYNRGGHGRKRKFQKMEAFGNLEKRYVENKLHLYSKRLIDSCIKNGAGKLFLVGQTEKEEIAKSDEFLLRNWSYYGLKELISYKANMAGIHVIIE